MLPAIVRDHGDYQHTNAETHGGCANADAKPSEDDQVHGSRRLSLRMRTTCKDKSVPSIKKLNAMTDTQVHQFLPPSVPGLNMDMFERLKKLNFHNWADFYHSVKAPVAVARGMQARLKELLDPSIEAKKEKSWELYACKFDDDS